MAEIKYFDKTPREIAEQYFDRANLIKEGRTEQEIEALYEGFVEGLTYIYPMFSLNQLIVEVAQSKK